jgi:outer membrane immunogenic protein
MKLVLLSGVALAALMGTASAADIPRRVEPAPVPYVYNWTGFYAGINGGVGWGDAKIGGGRFFGAGRGDFDDDHVGGLVGGTIGYNWQGGNWLGFGGNQILWGFETDLQWADLQADGRCRGGFFCEVTSEWFGTVRGRVGWVWDRFLIYGTGGLAYADVSAHVSGFRGTSDTVVGWTAGGGVEFALSAFGAGAVFNPWTAKIEYLFVDLDDLDCGGACGPRGRNNVEFQTNVVRAGLNYRW